MEVEKLKRLFSYTLFTLLAAVFISVGARAEGVSSELKKTSGSPYFFLGGGIRHLTGEADSEIGYLFSGGVGYDSGSGLRAELEVAYSSNNVDLDIYLPTSADGEWDLGLWSFLVKSYYDFHNLNNSFVPFVGTALGWTRAKHKLKITVNSTTTSVNDTENYFNWGSLAGFRIPVGEKVFAELEGSIIGYGLDDTDWSTNVQVRLSYKF